MGRHRYPACALEGLVSGQQLVRDQAQRVDVRAGIGPPDFELLAVASPDYLARHGEPKTPADLSRHACINWRFPGSGKIAGWTFEKKGKAVEFFGEGTVIANHQDIIVPAALQGLGILYAYNDDDIAAALESGRLKRVLADWSPTVPGLYLYYSSRRYMLPALRAFIDCLLDRDIGSAAPSTSGASW